MKDITVAQWATDVDDFISCYEPVWKAWRVMKEKGVRLLPVLSNKKVVGLVTAQDIVRASDHNGGQSMAVKEAMSLDPLIVHEDTSV
ncbi:MAG: CBS domain-containing protein, partial [Bdellovibrionales bacterium]|nr:CBS domain-containing protein [Bdellovibrionales bacterium]